MDELNKLRDRMAEAIEALGLSNANAPEFFCNGWNEALKTLSEAAGEFDAKAFREKWQHLPASDYQLIFLIAKEQFDQMSARVGLALERWHAQADTIKQLEARCKELEAELIHMDMIESGDAT